MRLTITLQSLLLGVLLATATGAAEQRPTAAGGAGGAGGPAPAAEAPAAIRLPLLRLHGDALAGPERKLSVEQVEALATVVAWTVRDPYKRRDNRYDGILLKDLVNAVAPQAQRVRMRAVNDYVTWFERREWESLPIMLATRDEGQRMAVADKGPARIVYRQDAKNELQMQVHAPKWIWQVVDVEFHAR